MPALDAVILDYGGVLCLPQPPADRARLERLTGGDPARFWHAYWAERTAYDRGDVDGPGYWARVGARLGRSFSPAEAAALAEADARSWGHADRAMVEWARALRRAGVATALLSNMPVEVRDHLRRELPWLADFACATYSCDLRVVKPDPAIYRHCLERLGVRPDRALFVDDREENVEGARRAGLRGALFTSAASLAADLRARFRLPAPGAGP